LGGDLVALGRQNSFDAVSLSEQFRDRRFGPDLRSSLACRDRELIEEKIRTDGAVWETENGTGGEG
jgi:hypothetical protein